MIDTDYENYALLYGCNRLWWSFGLLANEKVTYLSRETYSEIEYVKAAKDFLKEYTDYHYAWNWIKTGLECGFDAAPTYEELMIDLLSREPLWSDYVENSGNTQRAKDLF